MKKQWQPHRGNKWSCVIRLMVKEKLTVGDWGEFQNRVERTLEVGQLI